MSATDKDGIRMDGIIWMGCGRGVCRSPTTPSSQPVRVLANHAFVAAGSGGKVARMLGAGRQRGLGEQGRLEGWREQGRLLNGDTE